MDRPILDNVREFQKAQKSRILDSYKNLDEPVVKQISKAEFAEQFPAEKFEHYSVEALNSFRNELKKAEGDNADNLFQASTKDLKGFVVYNQGNKNIVFVRAKEKGE